MKSYLFIIIILLFSTQIFAQDIVTDTTLTNKYIETAEEYYKNKSYDTAIVHFKKASALYEKHQQWRKYLLVKSKQGTCCQKQWKLDQAIATIKPAIEKALLYINKNDTIVADAYNQLGFQYFYQSKYDSALINWERVLIIRTKLFKEKHTSVAKCYSHIGVVYWYKTEYDKALEYHFKALKINKELFGEKHISLARSYNNIGLVYRNKSKYDKALEYYFKS